MRASHASYWAVRNTKENSVKYDFETPVDRRGTGSLKWDAYARRGHAADELPLWVADMDFRVMPEAIEALRARVEHGVFGYTMTTDAYHAAVQGWFERHHGWRPQREWTVHAPGVVFALATAIRAYTQPGDFVLIQPPVYYPFRLMIENNGRRVAESPLVRDAEGRYAMDFEGFERALEESGAKLFILCSPHNPVGREWTADELRRVGEICLAHGVTVVSDEIHADFARPGVKHVPFASLGERFAQNVVLCTSPSKTFNLAGLQICNIFIPNADLRAAFQRTLDRTGYDEPNCLGACAAQACYERGDEWFAQLQAKLEENYAVLKAMVERTPSLKLTPLESTYLPWIDCSALGMGDDELASFISKDAKLWLDMGTMFGAQGSGFIRMNIASPTPMVQEACNRLAAAVAAR